jgi:hypothetical protein
VGIGSNAREEGSGKNGYVCGYLHSAQQDAMMDVAPHNHTCTQGEASYSSFHDSGEPGASKQKGGVVVGSLCALRTRLSWPRHVSRFLLAPTRLRLLCAPVDGLLGLKL